MYKKEVLQKFHEKFNDLELLAQIIRARTGLSLVKVKMRNMLKDHPKFESLVDKVARQVQLPPEVVDLCIELEQCNTSEELQGLGACKPDKFWQRLELMVNEYKESLKD